MPADVRARVEHIIERESTSIVQCTQDGGIVRLVPGAGLIEIVESIEGRAH